MSHPVSRRAVRPRRRWSNIAAVAAAVAAAVGLLATAAGVGPVGIGVAGAVAVPRAQVSTVTATSAALFTLPNSELDEISGAVVGTASAGVLYAQNDSGDSARYFALNASTGALIATCAVPGAKNVDWEDMAGGRAADGTPSIWIGDIGDNDSVRDAITIYQVTEPQLPASGHNFSCATPPVKTWTLTYPDGAQNAESLLYAPTSHRLYVVTKTFTGASQIYEVPTDASPGSQSLTKVGQLELTATTTPGGPVGFAGSLLVTGGAISSDGTLLALRTYTDGYLWRVTPGAGASADGVAAAFRTDPVRFALPEQPQGEGIAFTSVTGSATAARQVSLIIDSEKKASTVFAVDVSLPAAAATSGQPATATTSAPDGPSLFTLRTHAPNRTPLWITLAVASILVAGAAAALSARRRGRRP